ncbi:MAG: hypothetical protein CL610_10365 [Anaerolineaceae bacterium]|nr:hypothetical protein [Anaerolineaceae bacterium]
MPTTTPINLHDAAVRVRRWCDAVAVPDQPYGTYRFRMDDPANFYASCDVAIMRWMTGENLRETLSATQRQQWVAVINSYQQPHDGHYGPEMNHHIAHANGTASKALSALGGSYRYPVGFFRLFNTPEKVGPWLTQIQWTNSWSASHLVIGGPVLWMNYRLATDEWKAACFAWFDAEVDQFGTWPRTIPYDNTNPLTPIGCGVHMWPLYRHAGRPVPQLEYLADLALDTQQPAGYWDRVGGYGTLDALYVLAVAVEQDLPRSPAYRDAVARYVPTHFAAMNTAWRTRNAHEVQGWTGCIGYMQRTLPDRFAGDMRWGDIFDLKELFDLDTVLGEHII